MTGPEHYRAAGQQLALARTDTDPDERATHRELALIHAQLAQAAAFALGTARQMPDADRAAWIEVASEHQRVSQT